MAGGLVAWFLGEDIGTTAVDACTLNNALNIAQLVALVAIIRWLRTGSATVTK